MDTQRLYEILNDCTVQLRKAGQFDVDEDGPVKVVHVNAMPHESEAREDVVKIDCHFMIVGVDKAKAEQYRDELRTILDSYPNPDRLRAGPSYIEVGATIGDQGSTFQLYALGEVLDFWKVITPGRLGVTGPDADNLAGNGLVLTSGYFPDAQPAER